MSPAFSPVPALAGGILLGLAAVILYALNGRIAGVSGIAQGALAGPRGDRLWRLAFLAGLAGGAFAWHAWTGAGTTVRTGFPPGLLVLAGLLVGWGTSMAGGCTSGHGICGLARLSPRSFAAVGVFLTVALVTTFVVRQVLHVG